MILLLNYLPAIIVTIGLYVAYRVVRSARPWTPEQRIMRVIATALVSVVTVLLLQAATPHYMPKNTIKRSTVPAPEATAGEIKNLQPQPVSGDDRDAKRLETYKTRNED